MNYENNTNICRGHQATSYAYRLKKQNSPQALIINQTPVNWNFCPLPKGTNLLVMKISGATTTQSKFSLEVWSCGTYYVLSKFRCHMVKLLLFMKYWIWFLYICPLLCAPYFLLIISIIWLFKVTFIEIYKFSLTTVLFCRPFAGKAFEFRGFFSQSSLIFHPIVVTVWICSSIKEWFF